MPYKKPLMTKLISSMSRAKMHIWYGCENCQGFSVYGKANYRKRNAALFITDKADAEGERIKILKHLLNHGLDVYNVSKSGKTVLVNARKNNLKDIEQYLSEQFPKLIGTKRSISY